MAHEQIQRLLPTHTAPGIRAAIIANLGVQQSTRIAENLVSAAASHAKEALTVRALLSPLTVFSLPPSTSTNIPQNVGWQFMGHMVRTTFVPPAVMAVSARTGRV
jgi:hypothetical protein